MKIIFYLTMFTLVSLISYPQEMIIQKTDGSNSRIDLSLIDKINFIIPCPETPTVDYGGKTYNTVLIGTQCWLKENLDIGTMASPSNDGVIQKYCYNNVPDSCTKYGGLYSWGEAMQYSTTTGAQGICPSGWHMPTASEFQTLKDYVNSDGNSLKDVDQGVDAGQGTNLFGFAAILAGGKGYSGGPYQGLGDFTTYWVGQQGYSSGYAYSFEVYKDNSTIDIFNGSMTSWGFSVRCIKN